MPYRIEDLMNREAERERQRRPQEPTKIEAMATKAEIVKPIKAKKVKPSKVKKQPMDLTPLQQKTLDYASVFLTVLLGILLLTGVVRLCLWMFGV